MKLNKYKVGSIGLAAILILGLILGFSGVVRAETHTIENETQFDSLTGDYLSNQTASESIEPGDTLELDFSEVSQERPLLIDLEGITIKPKDEDSTVTLIQGGEDGTTWNGLISDGEAEDDGLGSKVSASIVVLADGVTLDSIRFQPETSPTTGSTEYDDDPKNAIEVDYCSGNGSNSLLFHNLEMPVAESGGSFINGIKFDGNVSGMINCGTGGIDYTGEMYFRDVRLEGGHGNGIEGNGLLFTQEVGNVASLHLEEFYVGNIGGLSGDTLSGYSGNGVLFNNKGSVKDIEFTKSERRSPSVSELPYAIEENDSNGILVNGAKVTDVDGFELNYTRIEGNGTNGLFVKGNYSGSDPDPISSLGMTVKNTLIAGNEDHGIFVGPEDGSYSPIKVDDVQLGENLTTYGNTLGAAVFNVQVVNGSEASPALIVKDSQFHRDESADDSEVNDQDYGLKVDAYEGIFGVHISGSTFRYHGVTETNGDEGTGIELITPISSGDDPAEEYYDPAEDIKIENTSSQYNHGPGLTIAANVVKNVEVTSTGSDRAKFSGNSYSGTEDGIYIYGPDGVNDLTVSGSAGGGEVLANYNDAYGLLVESEEEIRGVTVENAQFGDEVNNDGNGASGVRLVTTGSGDGNDIGSTDQDGAISFDNVTANGNDVFGLEVDSAGSFLNPAENIFVNNSEFKQNDEDGLVLLADETIKHPRIENSHFVSNNINGGYAGIYMRAEGEEIKGTGNGDIVGNVVANNEIGIAVDEDPDDVGDPTDDSYMNSIRDFSIVGNTTVHPDDSDKDGNSLANVVLVAGTLNTVKVEENLLVSSYSENKENTEIGLLLRAVDSSASISVSSNKFDSGAEGNCLGIGTAIVLDAKKTTVTKNQIDGFSTAIAVEKEDSGSTAPEETSNHINENDILGCCVTIDSEALDYSNGEKVDATNNYWGADATKETISRTANMKTDSENPLDQVFVEPLRDEPVSEMQEIEIPELNVITADPVVDEPVELEYELMNNSSSEKTVDADLTITDPNGETVYDETVESGTTIEADSVVTGTAEFTPETEGDFTAEMSVTVSGKTYTKTTQFTISKGGPPEPEKKEPYWGTDSEPAKSGVLPAPVDGSKKPFLELANKNGIDVASYVTINSMKVFDLTGAKVIEVEDGFDDLSALEELENGLYLYTVELEDGSSPVMKFVVKN